MMKRLILLPLLLLTVACGTNAPETAEPPAASGEITVDNVRANMTLPSDTGSVWLTITNGTDTDDALVGADVPGCGAVELHNMMMEENVMVMREVDGGRILIPAGETVTLERGGLHMMCLQKEAPLPEGDTLEIRLQFAEAGTIDAVATVVGPGGMEMGDE